MASVSPTPIAPSSSPRRWLLAGVGVLLFHACSWWLGRQDGLWMPGLGLGLVLIAWFGYRLAPILAVDLILVNLLTDSTVAAPWLESLLLAGELALMWWCYADFARGARGLDDPRSATAFLIIVPGAITVAAALVHALLWRMRGAAAEADFWQLASAMGLSRALGLLTIAPLLLVHATPWLERRGWIAASGRRPLLPAEREENWGETIELLGLALGNVILTLALVTLQVERGYPGWGLWGVSLLLVVWTSLRQGLRGGIVVASAGSLWGLCIASMLQAGAADFSPLQGNLLAQCSTALLVGASSTWIQASEMRYRRVAGQIPVILYTVRLPQGLIVRPSAGKSAEPTGKTIAESAQVTLVSQASQQIFGVSPGSLEGPYSRWLQLVHPSDRELLFASLTQLCLQKQPVRCEYRITPMGAILENSASSLGSVAIPSTWVRDTLAPHYNAEGRLDGWDGVIEDVTEARALAHDLRRTTGMLQALVANLPTGVFFVQGRRGQPILVNTRARQLLGQREDPSAGIAHLAKVYRLHRPDGTEYPTDELPVVKALTLGVASTANDIVVHRPDGRHVPLITWAAPVDLGGGRQPDAAVWVMEDLSAIQQARERYQALVESLPIALLQFDANERISFCNPATQLLTGYTLAELQEPATIATMFSVEETARFRTALQAAVDGQPSHLEARFLARGAIPKVAYVLVQPHRTQGQTSGATCLMVDITTQRRLEEDLQASQRLELIGKLASGTVHDFNNLLTALIGTAAVAKGALPPDHPVHEDVTRIMDIGVQAAEMAGQLLAFSKQRLVEPRPVDLNTVVLHTLKILKSAIPENIEICTELAEDDVWVLADDTQLKQVVMNLCINARDAMPQGGTLHISTGTRSAGNRLLAVLTVQDSGCGMDAATTAHIFEPFFSTKERGTGLGLAVVQQIVHRFGGAIEVNSSAGHGTTMSVVLDASPLPRDGSPSVPTYQRSGG